MKKKINISKKLLATTIALGLTAGLNAGAVSVNSDTILSAVELPSQIVMNDGGGDHKCGEGKCGDDHECGEDHKCGE